MPYKNPETKAQYAREWIAKRRQNWITEQGGKCVVCGSTDALEVDHIDRTTKAMNPRSVWSRTEAARQEELAKCQVLCSVCHKAKSRSEKTKTFVHGEYKMYSNRGCRCDLCRMANRDRMRAMRAA